MVTETAPKSVRGLSSIRAQLILGFGLILALLLITALIGYFSLQSFQTEVEVTLNKASRIRELGLEIENEFLLARQSEAGFVSSWRQLGLEAAKDEYLSDTQNHITEARLKLVELENLAQDISDEELRHVLEDAAALKPLLDFYESSLLTTVGLIEQRSQTGGLEQTMQVQLDELSLIVEPLPNPQFNQLILRIRADEQGFFNSGLQQYVDNLSIRVRRFKKLVETSSPGDLTANGEPVDPLDLVARVEAYQASFNELVNLEQQIDTNTTVFQDVTNDINTTTAHIRDEGAAGLARAQLRLDTISRQTTIALIVAAAIAFIFGIVIVIILVRRIVGPLNLLTQAAVQIGQGKYTGQLNVPRQDEFGLLADAFNSMSAQLRNLIDSLEDQVQARTQRLEVVGTLNERLAAILDVNPLLQEMVDQIQASFYYYHAHVYLLDMQQEKLVMAAGTGEAGAEMQATGHSIPVNAPTSLVARAARFKEIVSVDNVREADDWLPNPLLPNTYSEMAVPIILEGQVVGVLDVQEDEIAGLDEGDASLLRSLANQVAVGIRNARQFDQAQQALAQAQAAQEQYVEQVWDRKKVARGNKGQVRFSLGESTALTEEAVVQARKIAMTHPKPTTAAFDGGNDNTYIAPITLRNMPIGNLQLHGLETAQDLPDNEKLLVEAIIDQVAQAAENLRLINETRERAGREQLITRVSDKLRRAPDIETLMNIGIQEIAQALGSSRTFVRLGSEGEFVKDNQHQPDEDIGKREQEQPEAETQPEDVDVIADEPPVLPSTNGRGDK